jgi:single-strand DNA-binding protein
MAVNGVTATFVGNVTRDPEVKYTKSGLAVCKFGIAVNFRKPGRDDGDEWEEEVSFFDVVVFGDMGENVSDSVGKGARVMVLGRLQIRDWETEDGRKGRSAEVVADEVSVSLRWATAVVERTSNDKGGGGNRGGRGGNRGGGRQQSGRRDFDDDEEPF